MAPHPQAKTLYSPLNIRNEEVRLLRILPEAHSQDIHCELETVSLKGLTRAYQGFLKERGLSGLRARTALQSWTEERLSPTLAKLEPLKRVSLTQPSTELHRFTWGDFAAISYVWGDQNETRPIFLNGRVVRITINLERALHEFRNSGEFCGRFRLWVDALSINQSDLDERASVVRSMPQIYGSAWSVVAWLGKASSRSGLGLQLVRDLVTIREGSCEKDLEVRLRDDPTFLGSLRWLGLSEFMERPYWSRLWIMQEIVMGGTRTVIRCGNASIDWTTFCAGIAVLQESLWVVKDQCLKVDIAATASQNRILWKTTSLHLVYRYLSRLDVQTTRRDDAKLSLGRLLQLANDSACLDPRDKVFGLVGFMPAPVTQLLHPNYTLPVAQVYLNATKAFIQGLDDLEPLREANPWGPTDCPSWAADWCWPGNPMMQRRLESPFWGPTYLFPRALDTLDYAPYRASGSAKHSAAFYEEGLLECQGFIIGQISGLSARGSGFFAWDESTIVNSDDFVSAYGDHEATAAAVSRTLVMDRNIYGRKVTEQHAAVLQIPSTFNHGALEFVKRGWSWLADLRFYYFRWEKFRQSNSAFRIGGTKFDDFFENEISAETTEYNLTEAYSCFDRSSQKRRFMTTSTGHVGWAPDNIYGTSAEQTQVGDCIAIVFGCSTPLAIRKVPNQERFQVLGEVYVQGLMDGEAMVGLGHGTQTLAFC